MLLAVALALLVMSAEACVPALEKPAETPSTACCQAAGSTGGGLDVAVSLITRVSMAARAVEAFGLTSFR